MIKIVYVTSLLLLLVVGFSGSFLVVSASDENYREISKTVDSTNTDQITSEEERRIQQAKDTAEERRIQQAKDTAEERRIQQAKDTAEERRIQQAKDTAEERRIQQAKDTAEERRIQQAKDTAEERRIQQAKDTAEETNDSTKEQLKEKQAEIKEKIQIKIDNIQKFRESVTDKVANNETKRISLEIREKIKNAINDRVKDKVYQEIREDIREELHVITEYRIDLIKSKIDELGKDKFHDIVLEYKQRIHEETKERIDAIRDKMRSYVLIDQVEDGSYYGDIIEHPEENISNYVLSFQGDAFSTSNKNDVKSVSGDVNLELLRLNDSTASLKIIGGQILVEDTETGELHNVYDVTFGRSRANFDTGTLQVVINTVSVDGQPHTFAMQTIMDGVFPTDFGERVDIYTNDGKSKSGVAWILDLVGTLAVDVPIPITEFEDNQ